MDSKSKLKLNDIAILSLMSSILFVVQFALGFIPNVELVSLLIIIYTLFFGYKALFIIYIFVLLQGISYGFGLWWINYLYVWTILFFITRVFRKEKSPFVWAIISAIYGLSFGALCSLPYFFMGGVSAMFAYWTSGILFDIAHGLGNFTVALVLFKPLYYVFSKLVPKIYKIEKGNP